MTEREKLDFELTEHKKTIKGETYTIIKFYAFEFEKEQAFLISKLKAACARIDELESEITELKNFKREHMENFR